jgi:hypothetical protein
MGKWASNFDRWWWRLTSACRMHTPYYSEAVASGNGTVSPWSSMSPISTASSILTADSMTIGKVQDSRWWPPRRRTPQPGSMDDNTSRRLSVSSDCFVAALRVTAEGRSTFAYWTLYRTDWSSDIWELWALRKLHVVDRCRGTQWHRRVNLDVLRLLPPEIAVAHAASQLARKNCH